MKTRFASILATVNPGDIPARSLTIGCGDFPEFAHLINRWPTWKHIGLDVDSSALRRAPRDGLLICGDGRRLPFAANFSLILIRHPNIAEQGAIWGDIFRDVPHFLAENGLLVVTTYDLQEFEFARTTINAKNIPLDESTFAPPNLVGHDRYALHFRR